MITGLWQHLWPGFDAVWPNILASIAWAVPGGLMHLHTRRQHRHTREQLAELHAKHERLQAAITGSADDARDPHQ